MIGKTLRRLWVKGARHVFDYAALYLLILLIVEIGLAIAFWHLLGCDMPTIFGLGATTIRKSLLFLHASLWVFVIGVGPTLWVFCHFKRNLLKTVKSLLDQGCLAIATRHCNPVSSNILYKQHINLLEQYHAKLRKGIWLRILACVFLLVSVLLIYGTFTATSSLDSGWLFGSTAVLDALCEYALLFGSLYLFLKIGRTICLSGWYIRRLVTMFDLAMVPDHPDKCAGLSALGNLCIGLWGISFSGLALVLATVIFFFIEQPVWQGAFIHLTIGSVLLLTYVIPTIIWGSIIPLLAVHKSMRKQKERHLANENKSIRQLDRARIDALQRSDWETAKQQQQKIEDVKMVYSTLPIWPFKFRGAIPKALLLPAFNTAITGIISICIPNLGQLVHYIHL